MSPNLNTLQWKKTNKMPSDCLICAMRPGLYLNRVNICSAYFYCYHTNPPANPQFRVSRIYQAVNLICVMLLLGGILNDVSHIDRISSKNIILVIEIFFSFSSILMNLLCLRGTNMKIKEYHGLISIISNKLSFGVRTILSNKTVERLYKTLLYIILALILEELATFCYTVANDHIDLNLSIRMMTVEVNVIVNAALGICIVQYFDMYKTLFSKCYKEIENCFSDLHNVNQIKISNIELNEMDSLDKFRRVQRLYMSIRRNFQQLEKCISPEIVLIYNINTCLFLIGYGYFLVMVVRHEVTFLKFDYFIGGKSVAIVLAFGAFCAEMQKLSNSVDDILSFLFKYPISRLNPSESAQIEMMITTLVLQKPRLSASNMFNIGTGLLASVTGTVVTYILVALQFHAKAVSH